MNAHIDGLPPIIHTALPPEIPADHPTQRWFYPAQRTSSNLDFAVYRRTGCPTGELRLERYGTFSATAQLSPADARTLARMLLDMAADAEANADAEMRAARVIATAQADPA